MGAALTLMMYFSVNQIQIDEPEMVIYEYTTFSECEYYMEKYKPEIEKKFENGLLGYSLKCEII